MELTNFIQLLIGTGFVATLVSHFLSAFNNNIAQERIKWRERVRDLSKSIVSLDISNKAEAYKLYSELNNRLNPNDRNDIKLLYWAIKILEIEDKCIENKFKEYFSAENNSHEEVKTSIAYKSFFINGISLLLKDDWERCKFESNLTNIIPFIDYKNIKERDIKETPDKNKLCLIIAPILGFTLGFILGCFTQEKFYFTIIGGVLGLHISYIYVSNKVKFNINFLLYLLLIVLVLMGVIYHNNVNEKKLTNIECYSKQNTFTCNIDKEYILNNDKK